MLRSHLIAVSIAVAVAMPAMAGPKDKSLNTLIEHPDDAAVDVIDNALTQTLSKSIKCKLQVQVKAPIGADIADGDRFICLAEADINALGGLLVGGQSVVMTGEMFKGKMKLKADLSEIQCGVLGTATSWNGGLECFLDDPNYLAVGTSNPNAADELCDASPTAVWLPAGENAKGKPGAELKQNPGTRAVLGNCQSTVLGERIPRPASGRFGVQGQYSPLL